MKAFLYPTQPHARRHGPRGYANYSAYKPWLRDEFIFRCVYCLVREVWSPSGEAMFGTDHFVAQVRDSSKKLEYNNLLYACNRCNSWKQEHEVLDPRKVKMSDHLRIAQDGTIEALTPEAAEHVQVLQLDAPSLTEYRGRWMTTMRKLQSLPDEESQKLFRRWNGFPDDLPNLAAMRPPGGNTRPAGAKKCYYMQRQVGALPDTY